MKCINVNESCSYEDLFHWQRNENFSIGPLGLVCAANETYCIFTMSCIPNTTVCEKQIHYNAKRKKAEIACKLGEKFCPYTSSCKNLSDCRAAPSLNLSKALEDDYFGGWAHLCKMKNLVCPAVSHAVVKCAEARDKYDCNFCPDGHTFCTANGLCLKEGELCCPEGEEKCDFSDSCATPSLCKGYLTSCQSVTKGFYVSFSIDANFSEVQEYEEGFKKNVSQVITSITKINCIANMSLSSGSIHVSFILVPDKGQTPEDFQKALALLQSVVESGNFNVSLPSGLQVTLSAASLVIRPVTPATTSTSTTPFSTETSTKSKKNLTVIIVCSVVFGLLFLVIIAVLVALSLRKKNKSGRISPSQSQNFKGAEQPSLEMGARGHYNKTDHPGSNNNFDVKL
ncbi:uncharacterized protein [Acropora muricata]|uniref:uncharacterized protein n=1 Tax=Acropora muricata TaxID=159855 RepID=UPI0034E563FA